MDKTPFSEKLRIIADLYDDPAWAEFAEHHDIAIPAAWLQVHGFAIITPAARPYIDQTWETLQVICPLDDNDRPLTNRG
jgi:hypothetical protein